MNVLSMGKVKSEWFIDIKADQGIEEWCGTNNLL